MGFAELTWRLDRHLDAIGFSLRHTQELHFHTGAAHGCGNAEGGAGTEGMGLGYREEEAEGGEILTGLGQVIDRLRYRKIACA